MGWTEYYASYYDNYGRVDRKKECDSYFMEGLNRGFYKVLKSTMKGSIYYAAVTVVQRYLKDANGNEVKDKDGKAILENIPENEQKTYGFVFMTSVRNKTDFAYKPLDEFMGPPYYACPLSILALLSELPDTEENKYAINWRKKCKQYALRPKLGNLPIGTKIQYTLMNGKTEVIQKMAPCAQFKKPWWFIVGSGNTYKSKKRIPENFTVL